jgi:hypothetical protein
MPSGSKDQIIGGGTPTDLPSTIGRLPVYNIGGLNAHITDSVFGQADSGHQIIVGSGASVLAGQVSPNPIIIIGEGASGWGIGAIGIGRNVQAGVNASRDGTVVIGNGVASDTKNTVRIGSGLAFGTTSEDFVCIGTQTTCSRSGLSIGKATNNGGVDGVALGNAASNGEGSSVCIGRGATSPNSGLGTPNKNISIGDAAVSNPSFASSAGGVVTIGANATNNGQNTTVLGPSAAVTGTAVVGSIALGAFAVSTRSGECLIGDNTNNPITVLTLRPGTGVVARIRGNTAGVAIRNAADTLDLLLVDESAVANDTRLQVYDVTAAALRRVTIGVADSGGVGFRLLRIPN